MNWRENQIIKDFIMSNEPFGGTPFIDRLRLYRNTMNARTRPYDMPRQTTRGSRLQSQDIRNVRDQACAASDDRQWEELSPYMTDGRQETDNLSSDYKISVDVDHFTLDDLVVKVIGKTVIVKGQHDQRQEGLCTASRLFVKKYKMPDNVDLDFMKCDLTRDKYLIISAPVREMPGDSYRSVPIRKIETTLNQGTELAQPRPAGITVYSGQRSQVFMDNMDNAARAQTTTPRATAPPAAHLQPNTQQFSNAQPRAFAQTNADFQPRAATKRSADAQPRAAAQQSDDFQPRTFAQSIADFQPRTFAQPTADLQPRAAAQPNDDVLLCATTQAIADAQLCAATQPDADAQPLADIINTDDVPLPGDNAAPEQI